MKVPTNLTALAVDDYERILTESLVWGVEHSTKLRKVLLDHFEDIKSGVALGRKRDDVPFNADTFSIRVGRTPYLVFIVPAAALSCASYMASEICPRFLQLLSTERGRHPCALRSEINLRAQRHPCFARVTNRVNGGPPSAEAER